ncbi:hypothetical protein KQI36_12140 [Clostridium senegalense]|uniref:hypothetical protein n=1 Tax=Clostridium senegalense TaxID=1465809 RepID=UPI001C10A766|nr:hypothetical protein [Clostridium senegalense]MBU5227389.1 hypothetical protein [Clostridium senegalense]
MGYNDFQGMDPQTFIVIAEMIGNFIGGDTPFNVQNAIGNWLMLIGQAIVTYNAQQQYFEGGPGRCFDCNNFNINNPDVNQDNNNVNQNNNNVNQGDNGKNYDEELIMITKKINELTLEITKLKKEIELIKKD